MIADHRAAWLFVGLVLTLLVDANAQLAAPSAIQITRSSRSGLPILVTAQGGAPLYQASNAQRAMRPEDAAQVFLAAHGGLIGIKDPAREVSFRDVETDAIGFAHATYDQVYNGIPVFSGIVKVHQDNVGNIASMNGRFYPITAGLPVVPLIDGGTAERIAGDQFPEFATHANLNQLVIVDPGWYGDAPRGPRLAYYIKLMDTGFEVREGFFIDARTGEILDHWPLVHRAKIRQIYDAGLTDAIPGSLARAEGDVPVASPEDVNRAYDYYGDTYDYYFRAFGRDSINATGLFMKATVRFTTPNFCPNAFWDGGLQQMVFCQGTVTDDVVAHELTHGVTEFTSNLIYQNQSGALNESLSDIFGETIDLFNGNASMIGPPGGTPLWPTHPTGPGLDSPNNARSGCSAPPNYPDGVRWMLGEDATAFGGAIRDMFNPSCFGDPDRAQSGLMVCNPYYDNGGVHINSGVPNHCYSLMVDGGTFNGQTVNGIGLIKAAAVWYRAQTRYLTVASDFEDAYLSLKQSALDLVGSIPNDPRTGLPSAETFSALDAMEVEKACIAVEMNGPGLCLASDDVVSSSAAPICDSRTTIFADDFEHGVNGWASFVGSPPPSPAFLWQLTSDLPAIRSGTAWHIVDSNACVSPGPSGTYDLISPPITMPDTSKPIHIAFAQLMLSEGGWDGGIISYSFDDGATWTQVPRTMFAFNPYNGRLNDSGAGSTNPLGGLDAWTGASGQWGTSVITDSAGLFRGHTVLFRFEFSKDFCYGLGGWYIDDFKVFTCANCASDLIPNSASGRVSFVSSTFLDIEGSTTQSFEIHAAPVAVTDVSLIVYSSADWTGSSRYLDVRLNNTPVATLFQTGEGSCTGTPERVVATIPKDTFNAARDVGTGNLTVVTQPSGSVGSSQFCTGAQGYLSMTILYERAGETCQATSPLVLATLPDESVCFGGTTPPLGPTPLVTGGTPPYGYFWKVLDGPSSFGSSVATLAHPTLKPVGIVDHTIQVQVMDSSPNPQLVVGTFVLRVGTPVETDPGLYLRYHPIVTVGQVLAFGGEFTVTGGRAPITYNWSLLENPDSGGIIDATDPLNPTFVASKPGTYAVKLLAREFGGCTAEAQFALTAVANDPSTGKSGGGGGTTAGGADSTTCGIGTGLCAPTGILTIAGCMIGFGLMRGRFGRRRW